MAKASEIERSQRHTPRSIQPITVFETTQEPACGAVDVHEAQARAVCFKGRSSLVERIGDNNVVAYGLHVGKHVVVRQLLIHKRLFRGIAALIGGVFVQAILGESCKLKCVVINIYAAFGEIGCIQVALAVNESAGQACVSGTVGGLDEGDSMRRGRCRPLSYRNVWVPSGNRPINRAEEEHGRFSRGQQKIRLTAVEDSAGWRTRWRVLVRRIGRRDGNDQRLLNSCAVVKCAEARRVVRDPPG